MINLIKMNLYRMMNATSTKVLAIVSALFGLMQFGILKLIADDPFNIMGSAASEMGFDSVTGATLVSNFLRSSNFLIIVAVFVVLFANAEQKCGFDKNIIGITKHRWLHPLSRFIAAVIGVTALMAITGIIGIGCSALFVNAFSFGSATAFIKALGLTYLGTVALSGVFFFFTTAFRSAAGGVVPSLVICTGILYMIEQLLDLLVKKVAGSPKLLPTDLFLDAKFLNFNMDSGMTACLILAAVCVGYLVFSVGGSMLLTQKRDVK